MMLLQFEKYHGTGNDFILIDGRSKDFKVPRSDIIKKLCNRRFGIGADGLIIIQESDQHDFRMRYYNSDGLEGTLCGNGGRCAVDFCSKLGMIEKNTVFEAIDGLHRASIPSPGLVKLELADVTAIHEFSDHYELDTGSPHYVKFVHQVDTIDAGQKGADIRYRKPFKEEGINVNFVEEKHEGLFVRTYERGVENETYSCGTGVVASAICAAYKSGTDKKSYCVNTQGGKLEVSLERTGDGKFTNILLTGPVTFVFSGETKI